MKARGSLIVYPYWRSNPYVTLTLLAAAADRYIVSAHNQLDEMLVALERAGRRDIMHLHWTSPICQQAEDVYSALQRLKLFVSGVDEFRARGGKLVWTVHNAQPHELDFPQIERKLMVYLALSADLIHVMNPGTADLLEPTVTLPVEKVRVVPHPSYSGIYPASITREQARQHFGLFEEDRVIALIGQLRTYKGVRTLLDAVAGLPAAVAKSLVLLLAGQTPDDEIDELKALLPGNVRTVFHPEFVETADLAVWFRAADVIALPYERILNSGSAHLAATFGTPVVLPGEKHLRKVFAGEAWVRFYDPDRPVASLRAVLADPATYTADREEARTFSERLSPWRVSERMLDDLYRAVNA